MIIVGAGGHAKEILGTLVDLGQAEGIYFYDDVTAECPEKLYDKYPVIRTIEDASAILKQDRRFILGIGKPMARKMLCERFISLGGELTSVISPFARIGSFSVVLEEGLNIMAGAIITQDIFIGKGSIVHNNATVHHDCKIGNFCEISPGAHLLGKVIVGDHCSIGTGAIILPGIELGQNVVIGAGAVVTKRVLDNAKLKGVPAV